MQEKIEVAIAATNSNSSDDSQEVDVIRLYFEVMGGDKKWRVYGLGSQALTSYPDSNSATSRTLHAVPDHAAG
ncbi:hypothetical protein A4A49_55096 [Nicotiana attenuata]|uniref:Uncharacterized protein n=1 Tax=Nicotiana attenuata TaxID=49451 RepID=A0A1J6J2Q4_NICAT|nr:hypothetical protein A4A49_55096 [Nicotiana attenuata]